MEEKAVEILKRQMLAQKKAAERGAEPFLQQAGQLGTEDDPQAVAFDAPAHDVLGVPPKVFARRYD